MNFLRLLRSVMLGGVFVMILVMFAWPYYQNYKNHLKKSDLTSSLSTNDAVKAQPSKAQKIENAEFISQDKLGRKIEVKAKLLEKTAKSTIKGLLSRPSAVFQVAPGIAYRFSSLVGVFNHKKDEVKLVGKVDIKGSDGYRLKVDNVKLKMKKKKIFSNQKAEVVASNYKIKSNKGFEIDSSGKIQFKGKTVITFNKNN